MNWSERFRHFFVLTTHHQELPDKPQQPVSPLQITAREEWRRIMIAGTKREIAERDRMLEGNMRGREISRTSGVLEILKDARSTLEGSYPSATFYEGWEDKDGLDYKE